ncbi:carbon-nitrogen hydrolase family protein [Anaerosacchariphilus polymeriproducens]|uniref:Carbon-nitrogen hydrolase family protein n=1 Tax=Anaerosacchariphilus polymeriproducens TaxID=1812858 RepID=A0A371ASQ0_9FIRM|nr:carbon-nitrogen hydrolase family protein [Anaerosacchariphilus polymeriproducens]RDU22603.1 carbon-nitrogen hydrolase family protein [Anaerosacchariphilus polymeriproducens]
MRIFALELNNDIKGIEIRKQYIENLISKLPSPDLVVLPELAMCSYIANQEIWQYADSCGKDTKSWAMQMAAKYNTYIGVGYLDRENRDYYNRYLVAGKDDVYGVISKSEGESAVFKRGYFDNIIKTPFGNVAVGICYDSRRKHLYDNIKDVELSMILFPHGCPADPKKPDEEQTTIDYFCGCYEDAFSVPVVYVNSVGKLEDMPGVMGKMMKKQGFTMNGKSKIYSRNSEPIYCESNAIIGANIIILPQKRIKEIHFHGEDIIRGNWFFRTFVLIPDTKKQLKSYEENR